MFQFIVGIIIGISAGMWVGTRTAFARLGRVEHRNRTNAVRDNSLWNRNR